MRKEFSILIERDNGYDDPNRTQDLKLKSTTERFWVDRFVIGPFSTAETLSMAGTLEQRSRTPFPSVVIVNHAKVKIKSVVYEHVASANN